jgi:hypothetical protein
MLTKTILLAAATLSVSLLAIAGDVATSPTTQPTSQPSLVYKAEQLPAQAITEMYSALAAKDASADSLRFTAKRALEQIPAHFEAHARLKSAIEASNVAGADAVSVLQPAMKRIAGDLGFKPTGEAETPVGWPPYTPPGEIELKSYPLYRMAIVDEQSKLPQGAYFFALFGHISNAGIAMTAPVEMELEGDPSRMNMRSMAFLYRDTNTGPLGVDENVRIVDVQPYLAVVVGMRGDNRRAALDEAKSLIESWLTANADRYEKVGDFIVNGYNSPSMPDAKKYSELQVKVRAK